MFTSMLEVYAVNGPLKTRIAWVPGSLVPGPWSLGMPPDHNARLAAEQRAQVLVDSQFVAASWEVQDRNDVNLFAAAGVAVREAVIATAFEPEPKRFFPP